jgi:hypothetical protein
MIKKIKNRIVSLLRRVTAQNLKIEYTEEDKTTGLVNLIVTIDGRCTPPIKREPFELLKEISSSTQSFSAKDFNLIIHYMLENQKRITEKKHQKAYSLIKHQFSDQLEEPLVVFKDVKTDQIHIKAAKDIFANLEIIKKFNSEDSVCIGNLVGYYEAEKEFKRRQMQIHNSNNVIKFDTSLLSGGKA